VAEILQVEILVNGTKVAADELQKVINGLKGVGSEAGKAADKVKGSTEALETFGKFGPHFQLLADGFGKVKKGLDVASDGFKVLRGSIIATGIGALAVALGAVYQYFTSTKEGADKLSAGLAYMKGLVQPLINLFTEIGRNLVATFSNPKKALMDLVDTIKDNLINRFKAFAVIIEGIKNLDFKQITNGTLQLTTGVENLVDKTGKAIDGIGKMGSTMSNSANKAMELEKAMQANTRAQKEFEVQQVMTEAKIQQLTSSAAQQNLTLAQRQKNLQEAARLDNINDAKQLALLNEQMRIRQQLLALKGGEKNASAEELDALKEVQKKINEVNAESMALDQEIANKGSKLEKKAGREALKDDKAIEAEKLRIKKEALAAAKELIEESYNDDLDRLTQQLANGEIKQTEFDNQRIVAENNKTVKLIALNKDYGEKTAALHTTLLNGQIALNNKELAEATKLAADKKKLDDKALKDSLDALNLKLQAIKQAGGDGLALELGLLDQEMAQELSKTDLTEQEKANIREKYRLKEEALEKASLQKSIAEIQSVAQGASTALNNIHSAQTQSVDNEMNQQLKTIRSKNEAELANVRLTEAEKAAIYKQKGDQRSNLDAALAAKKTKLQQKQANDEQKIQKDANDNKKQIDKEYADIQFAIAAAQIIAQTALAIMKDAPVYPKMIIDGIIGATQLVAAEGQRESVQSLGMGGWIGGQPHEMGGTMVNAEGGEYMVNKRAMAIPGVAEAVTNMNAAGNGASFDSSRVSASTNYGAGEKVTRSASDTHDVTRVYMVESDVTDIQNKVSKIKARAQV
jgi:hypothetical protein